MSYIDADRIRRHLDGPLFEAIEHMGGVEVVSDLGEAGSYVIEDRLTHKRFEVELSVTEAREVARAGNVS